MKLFISHASEDKPDFVRPLVEALKQYYEVWYDEVNLRVGQSLREEIDKGLRESDVGVVVLSQNFFRKGWTKAELDGLLDAQLSTGKLLLPVWHGVGVEDVRDFSRILASRVGANSSKGIDSVVDELRLAIDASETTKTLAPSSSTSLLIGVGNDIQAARHEGQTRQSRESAALVTGAFAGLHAYFNSLIESANSAIQEKVFGVEFSKNLQPTITVTGPKRLILHIQLSRMASNSAALSQVDSCIFYDKMDFDQGAMDPFGQSTWYPRFILDKGVLWSPQSYESGKPRELFTAIQLGDKLIQQMHSELNK